MWSKKIAVPTRAVGFQGTVVAPNASPNTEAPRSDEIVSALLAEYNTLRTESLLGIQNRIAIVTFAFGAISVLIAGLLNSSAPKLVTGSIGLLVIPQAAKASILMWLGEYKRSSRAGAGIKRVEDEVNDLFGRRVMAWESGLVASKSHMSYPYLATIFFVLFASYASSFVGLVLLGDYFQQFEFSLMDIVRPWVPDWLNNFAPGQLISSQALFYIVGTLLVGVTEFLFYLFVRVKWTDARSPFG